MNTKLPSQYDKSIPTFEAFRRSWRSMKTWVRNWLIYLNLIYILSFAFLFRTEAIWAIIATLLIIPIMMLVISKQRGITRFTGVIHFPWLVFTFYLGLRLFTDSLGTHLNLQDNTYYYIWLQVIFWSTLVCLLFDIYDVFRWFRGSTYRLGTPAAVEARASNEAAWKS